MDWKTRLARLLEQEALERDTEARFLVYWTRTSTRSFEALPLAGTFMGRVTPDMIAELEAQDFTAYLERLQGRDRTFITNTWNRFRKYPGRPTSLNQAASGYLVALDAPQRRTLSVNVYRMLYADSTAFLSLLPDPQRTRGTAALAQGSLPARASLQELYTAIGPLPGESAESADIASNEEEDDASSDETDADISEDAPWAAHPNVIFFGPPGTGKSFRLQDLARRYLQARDRLTRVTFHPEYGHHDFVGAYRPVVGWLPTHARFELHDGDIRQAEPRVYYRFEPGPFARILVEAIRNPTENHVLVIEEINRGNCAAIFGDIFQLLDRAGERGKPETWGRSEYAIHPVSELAAWLDEQLKGGDWPAWTNGRLRLPRNLFLWATMNTSDQGLFPMDTAFKRRWAMEYMGVEAPPELLTRVPLHGQDRVGVLWRDLLQVLNEAVVAHTRTDDKQMGPWFVRPARGRALVDRVQFSSKVLFYLWSDVFRDEPQRIFLDHIHTYDQLVRAYRDGSVVFRKDLLAPLRGELDDALPTPSTDETEPA